MFKKLGIKALALAAVMAVAAPAVTFARDSDDYRGRGDEHREMYRGSSGYDSRMFRQQNQDRDRWNLGLGWYSSPAPVARGYNGQGYYGQGYEGQYGAWNSYGNRGYNGQGSYGQGYAGQYGARNSYNNNDGARWR